MKKTLISKLKYMRRISSYGGKLLITKLFVFFLGVIIIPGISYSRRYEVRIVNNTEYAYLFNHYEKSTKNNPCVTIVFSYESAIRKEPLIINVHSNYDEALITVDPVCLHSGLGELTTIYVELKPNLQGRGYAEHLVSFKFNHETNEVKSEFSTRTPNVDPNTFQLLNNNLIISPNPNHTSVDEIIGR